MKRITAVLMATHLIERFGYAVLPVMFFPNIPDGRERYRTGRILGRLWGELVPPNYRVIGESTRGEWQKHARHVNLKWPGFIDGIGIAADGYEFFMIGPLASEKENG